MRRLFLLFVAFFATYYLWAQDVIFKSGDLYYTIRQMTYAPWEIAEVCTLPNPEGYSIYYNAAYHDLTEAIIPETVEHEGKTYPVTSIGYGAFHNSTRLKSVTIPSSVTMIWDEAFCRCDSLTTINIPNSVTDIGRMAFELCQSLTSLHIPEGVWQIGEGAFQGCWKLTDLTLPNSLKILGKGALSGCGFTSFTIPSGISTLSMGLFGSCMDLKSLVIPNNITTIESDVFVGCLGLTSIEIPNSVESLGSYAFSGCDNLETVILSEKLTVIEDGTFTNCPNIKNIYFNSTTPPSIGGSSTIDSSTPTCYIPCGTLEAYEASDWAEQVGSFVENCEAVVPDSTHCIFYTSTDGNIVEPRETDVFGANIVTNTYENGQGIITFDGPVTSIGERAFSQCKTLTTIILPTSVNNIGLQAFMFCEELTEISIPENVTTIGEGAFHFCQALTSVELSKSLNIIEKSAFQVCTALTSISVPDSVTFIGNRAFCNCQSLSLVTIGSGMTMIDEAAFMASPVANLHMKSVIPPTFIADSYPLFDSSPTCYIPCGTLEAYEASDWAEQVGEFVEECENVLPDSTHCIFYTSTDGNIVEPRETDVFGANIVTNTYENGQGIITFDGPVTSIGERAFSQCKTLTTIILPTSVNNIGLQAFMFCEELTEISIPENVTTIGEGAFHFCQALTSVELSKSLNIIEKSAFQVCTALTSISVPDSVTFIGNRAFCNCQSLSLVTIGSGMTMIDEAAFMASPVAKLHMKSVIPPTFIADSYPLFDSSPTCYIPCGTLEAYEASDWAEQVGEFVEECEAEQYTRDVTPNRYGTICLPFGSTDFSGATFYEIAYKAPFMIYFDEVTKLEAGKPYIFYAHSNKLIVTSDGSRVNNPLFDNGLYGTFDEIVAAAINILTNNYIVNNNTLCLCGEYCSLSANRAYVKLDEVSSTARALSPGRKRVSMSVQGENTTTALDNISEETESITIKEGVYDILGRKMSQPVGMGFYIIDGQKVIISQ